jgi:hypothetical protein
MRIQQNRFSKPRRRGTFSPQAVDFIRKVVDDYPLLAPFLDQDTKKRAEELLEAHRRVRSAVHLRGVTYHVVPQLPPDVRGIYVYLSAA